MKKIYFLKLFILYTHSLIILKHNFIIQFTGIRINNADDNPEINAIAITPMNDDKINDNQNQLNKNCEDVCSIKGK